MLMISNSPKDFPFRSNINHVLYEAKKVAPLYLDEGAVLNRKFGHFSWLDSCKSMYNKEIKILEIFYFCF